LVELVAEVDWVEVVAFEVCESASIFGFRTVEGAGN
jgi:hypothetical protein